MVYADFLLRLFCRITTKKTSQGDRQWRRLDQIKSMVQKVDEAKIDEEVKKRFESDGEGQRGREAERQRG